MIFFDKVLNVLKSDERYFTAEGKFLKNAVERFTGKKLPESRNPEKQNIGRYWNIGPQLLLYIPWALLKESNEIIVFEEKSAAEPIIEITDKHILNGCKAYKNAEVVM